LNPLTYANLGHVKTAPEVHADGEIWMEALWEIRANLIAQFGEHEGRERVRQLVIDGMKLAVPTASMVDMRDAILLADRVDYGGESQSQLWAGFAKRGLGALAYSDGGFTVHVLSSFDLPSDSGAVKFYDNPVVIGEPARLVLQGSSYTEPSIVVQLSTNSGDQESLVLRQRGSLYVGSIATRVGAVTKANGALEIVPGDSITASYVNSGGEQVQSKLSTMPSYVSSSSAASFSFGTEQRNVLGNGGTLTYVLPFSFPFYDKHYGTAYVYNNGLIAFERPAQTPACTDASALRNYAGVTPLWVPMSLTGSAQSNEGLFISSGTDFVTFRWAGENTPLAGSPSPVNFAATLHSDGRIEFSYGTGNSVVQVPTNFNVCGPPIYGLSNGHGVYSQTVASSNYTNHAVVHFDLRSTGLRSRPQRLFLRRPAITYRIFCKSTERPRIPQPSWSRWISSSMACNGCARSLPGRQVHGRCSCICRVRGSAKVRTG
jgi:hypothetical protein